MRSFLRAHAALAVACALSAAAAAAAQQGAFRSGTRIVSLFATVTDAQGRLVPDLVKDDFEVFDNDKPQPLVTFDNIVQPFTVVVMLDTSGSMTESIPLLKQAAEQFMIRLLPDDKARVGAFNSKIQISPRFTNKRDELIGEIKNLDFGNDTRLWDAIDVSLDALKGVDGRRVVLVITDGDDQYSKTAKFDTVIDRARAEEVMVYAIGFESFFGNTRTRPDSRLRKIADETGGGYFELKRAAELASTFTRVAQELHSQYVMGFAPPLLDGKVHKVLLKVKKEAGMTARTRKSYVASAEKLTDGQKP